MRPGRRRAREITHEEAMVTGFRQAVAEYREPPDAGTLVPRAYMEMLDQNPVLLPAWIRPVAEDLGFGHLVQDAG